MNARRCPGPYPACIHRCTLACIFSVNRWDLVGAAPTERKSRIRNNDMSLASRAVWREAVKPLWLYSAAPLLFSFVLADFFFFFLFLSSLFIAAPLRLRSSFSRPRRFPSPHDIAICILLHAMSRDSVNSKDRTKRFGEFNVSALLSDDKLRIFAIRDDFSCWKESSYIKY